MRPPRRRGGVGEISPTDFAPSLLALRAAGAGGRHWGHWRPSRRLRVRMTPRRLKAVLIGALVALPIGLGAAGCSEPPEREPDASARSARSSTDPFDVGLLDSLAGAKGVLDPETGTYRLTIPRDDLVVMVEGVRLDPRGALRGWVTFAPVPGGAVLTAELPMLVDEVNPVMSSALLHDLHVTGLHEHLSRETPRVWYLHLAGIGEADSLATAVGAVLQTLADVRGLPRDSPVAIDPATTTLNRARMDSVLGMRGEMRLGRYEIALPRSTRLDGYALGPASGIASRVTFAGADDRAIASGQLVLIESELQPVLKVLRAGGVEITSLSDPLVGEEPRLVFVHFRGRGPAVELARVIREALDLLPSTGG